MTSRDQTEKHIHCSWLDWSDLESYRSAGFKLDGIIIIYLYIFIERIHTGSGWIAIGSVDAWGSFPPSAAWGCCLSLTIQASSQAPLQAHSGTVRHPFRDDQASIQAPATAASGDNNHVIYLFFFFSCFSPTANHSIVKSSLIFSSSPPLLYFSLLFFLLSLFSFYSLFMP